MARFYNRLMIGFLALFVFGVLGAFAYQILYVIPAQKCEGVGHWFDPRSRQCATPILLPHFTRRPFAPGSAAAAAEAAQQGLSEAERRSPQPEVDPRPAF